MARFVRWRAAFLFLAFALALLIAVFLTRKIWLGELGSYLVYDNGPWKSDAIVVLGGDLRGLRVLKAAELAQQGYAPVVLLSGMGAIYGKSEGALSAEFAVSHGFPAKLFTPIEYPALSTRDEAHAMVRELRQRGFRRFMLVTSNYHTRRATEVFRKEAQGLEFHTVAAPDRYFAPNTWWKSREGRKTFVEEAAKTIATWFGI